MYKTRLFTTTLTLTLLVMGANSCISKEETTSLNGNSEEKEITTIEATVDQPLDETKTIRNSDGSIWWRPGDSISLFFGNEMSRFTATNEENSPTAQFAGSLTCAVGGGEGVGAGNYFYGVYPYDPDAYLSNGTITTTLPYIQTAIRDSFPQDTFISIARSENTALSFYNLCGGFKFKLTHAGVKQVIISGHNNETVAGTVQISFNDKIPYVSEVYESSNSVILEAPEGETSFEVDEWYTAVLFPTVFANGLDFTFVCENEIGVYNRAAATTVSRSKFGTFKALDNNVVYVEKETEDTGDEALED